MYDFYRVFAECSKVQSYLAVFFFMVIYVVGNIVLLNLFLAILLANFDTKKTQIVDENEGEDSISDEESAEQNVVLKKIKGWFQMMPALKKEVNLVKPEVTASTVEIQETKLSPSIQRKTESKKIELDMIEKMKTSK